ncbi:MAG: hypothetical protein MZV65_47900 [Chromatiales bacterium]|nr:hypothetical protein [Chromatiales bacterium]
MRLTPDLQAARADLVELGGYLLILTPQNRAFLDKQGAAIERRWRGPPCLCDLRPGTGPRAGPQPRPARLHGRRPDDRRIEAGASRGRSRRPPARSQPRLICRAARGASSRFPRRTL